MGQTSENPGGIKPRIPIPIEALDADIKYENRTPASGGWRQEGQDVVQEYNVSQKQKQVVARKWVDSVAYDYLQRATKRSF